MQTFLQKNRMSVLHLLFWCIYFSLFFYQISSSGRGREQGYFDLFINALTHTLFLMGVAYANYFNIMPRFLIHKNGIKYAVEFTGMTLFFLILYIIGKRWIVDGYTHKSEFFYSTRFAIGTFVTAVLVSAFVALLRFFSEWQNLEEQRKELKNEKLDAELKFLKSQVNPHFLFNTLNNLYSLAYSQSPKTTEVISRLSQMMRYMVYDSNHDLVPLEKEIDYMQNYISLEKLRMNEVIPITFEIEGDPIQKKIAPLLLIPFLENAFKHGVSNSNPNSWVKAKLNTQGQHLHFEVTNSRLNHQGTAGATNSGIGLENVKKRLELKYQGLYHLKIDASDTQFSAILDIQLN